MKYRKNLDVILSKIDERYIVVKNGRVFNVNQIGARIIDLCDGKNTIEDIANKISTLFKVPYEEVKNDVDAYIKELLTLEIVKKIS